MALARSVKRPVRLMKAATGARILMKSCSHFSHDAHFTHFDFSLSHVGPI